MAGLTLRDSGPDAGRSDRTRPASAAHDVRGVPDHRRRARRPGRAADARRRDLDHASPSTPSASGGWPAASMRSASPRRHGRLHAHQPPGVPPARHGGDAPRRDPVLDLQHLLAGADRLPARRRRQPGDGRRGGVSRPRRGRRSQHVGVGRAPDRARRRRPRTRSRSRSSRRLEPRPRASTSRPRWRAVGARGRADADLHLRHHRPAQGRAAHPRQRAGAVPRARRGGELVHRPAARSISFLPYAHIADRGLVHYAQMVWGHHDHLLPGPGARSSPTSLDARPTRFGSVPRMWEKLKAALEAGIRGRAGRGQARRDARRRSSSGCAEVRAEQAGEPVPDELREAYEQADESGSSRRSAPGSASIAASPTSSAPRRRRSRCSSSSPRSGSRSARSGGCPSCPASRRWCRATACASGPSGQPLPGVEIRLADDGEVLVRGEIVMAGYRNQPEKTAETIDADGWLRTGDIGALRRGRLPEDRRPQEGADHQRRPARTCRRPTSSSSSSRAAR